MKKKKFFIRPFTNELQEGTNLFKNFRILKENKWNLARKKSQ